MKVKILKKVLIFTFILVIRYIGLYVCIDYGNLNILQVMSICNPLINAEPITSYLPFFSEFAPFGRTPLAYASSDFWRKTTNNNELDIIRILLENGADPNAGSPIEWCLKHGGLKRYQKAKLLIDSGANYSNIINLVLDGNNNDSEKIRNERFELFLLVLSNSSNKNTCLIHAILGNCDREAYYLLDNYDIDINKEYQTAKGTYTQLFYAARKRNARIFKRLIEAGANIDYVSSSGSTIEDIINSNDYDYGYDANNNWIKLDFASEKREMLELLRKERERKNESF